MESLSGYVREREKAGEGEGVETIRKVDMIQTVRKSSLIYERVRIGGISGYFGDAEGNIAMSSLLHKGVGIRAEG